MCAYREPQSATRSSSSIASDTLRPDRTASSNSSVRASTSRWTKGRWREIQQRPDEGLCETLSWRLLFGEAFASGLVTTRVSRAATEPPLQFSTAIGTSPDLVRIDVWEHGAPALVSLCGLHRHSGYWEGSLSIKVSRQVEPL